MASATYAVQLNCAKVNHRSHLFLSLAINTVLCVFYRTMLRRARLCDSKSSVPLSVTFRYDFHTGWNISKIISRPNSLRPMRLVTPT